MRPFTMIAHALTGHPVKVAWDERKSALKMKEMRSAMIREFNITDCTNANAIMNGGYDFPLDGSPMPTMIGDVVDPILSKIKHSGEDFQSEFVPAWQKFCSVPQDDQGVEPPVIAYQRKGQRAPSSLIVEQKAEPAKRKPGRPRREEMSAV